MVDTDRMLVALDLDRVIILHGAWEVDIIRRIRQGELLEIRRRSYTLEKARQC
jgi:hypothetical protein